MTHLLFDTYGQQKLNRAFIVIALLIGVLLSGVGFSSPNSKEGSELKRSTILAWSEIGGAALYELQLGTTRELKDPLKDTQIKEPKLELKLSPGTYYFRVRGVDKNKLPGPWSDIEGFTVQPKPPQPVSPKAKKVVKVKSGEAVSFAWESPARKAEYLFEIRDKKGVIFSRTTKDTKVSWKKPEGGILRWRVGFKNIIGVDWSKYRWVKLVLPEEDKKPEAATFESMAMEQDRKFQTHWLDFQLGGLVGFQSGGGKVYSAIGSWTPTIWVTDSLALRGKIGISAFKRNVGDKRFAVVSYGMSGAYAPDAFSWGAGLGAQTWVDYGTYFAPSATVAYRFGGRPLGLLERVYFTYSPVFLSRATMHQLELGVGFHFGG